MPGTFYQFLVLASPNVLNETLVKVGVGAKGLPMVCTADVGYTSLGRGALSSSLAGSSCCFAR